MLRDTVDTGEVVGFLQWQEDVMEESGARFYMMHVRFTSPLFVAAD